jgi:hypothetical protein
VSTLSIPHASVIGIRISFGFWLSVFGFYPCPSVIERAIYLKLVGLTCRSAFFFLQVNGLKTAASSRIDP